MSFSQRNGYEPEPVLQYEAMDGRLQNGLWSVFIRHVEWFQDGGDAPDYDSGLAYQQTHEYLKEVWEVFLGAGRGRLHRP